jgi:aminoglycoside phosphotransferase (APT) family kinase protein
MSVRSRRSVAPPPRSTRPIHGRRSPPGSTASSHTSRPSERSQAASRLVRFARRTRVPLQPEVGTPPRATSAAEYAGPPYGHEAARPAAWIQADTHLDNILWRLDGSAVILDWCNAAIGPPAVDRAGLLNEGVEPQARRFAVSNAFYGSARLHWFERSGRSAQATFATRAERSEKRTRVSSGLPVRGSIPCSPGR